MSKNSAEAGPNIIPAIRYKNAPAAMEWLARAFGLTQKLVVPGPDGAIAHAEMWLSAGVIMLGSVHDDALAMKSPRDVGAVTQGIYVVVTEVDAHFERAKAAGAEIVRPLQDTEYGSREYTCRDLEGHLWSFGTYRPGGSA